MSADSTLGRPSMKEPPVRIMADGQSGQMYDSLTDRDGKIVVSCHRDYQV